MSLGLSIGFVNGVADEKGVLSWWGERWHVVAFVFFLLCWSAGAIVSVVQDGPIGQWMKNVVLVSALITSLVTLGRQLPLQNVVIVTVMFGVAAAGWTHLFGSMSDFLEPNWRTIAFLTALFVNLRGAALFLLRSRRTSRLYGWEVMGASAAGFTAVVALVYHSMLPVMVAPFAAVALLLLTLPVLMNKRPAEAPVSWQPIVIVPLLLAWACLSRS